MAKGFRTRKSARLFGQPKPSPKKDPFPINWVRIRLRLPPVAALIVSVPLFLLMEHDDAVCLDLDDCADQGADPLGTARRAGGFGATRSPLAQRPNERGDSTAGLLLRFAGFGDCAAAAHRRTTGRRSATHLGPQGIRQGTPSAHRAALVGRGHAEGAQGLGKRMRHSGCDTEKTSLSVHYKPAVPIGRFRGTRSASASRRLANSWDERGYSN